MSPGQDSAFQCTGCRYQHRRFRAADGRVAFKDCGHPTLEPGQCDPLRELLARICLRDAQRGECVEFEAIVAEEGAYLSEDLMPDLDVPSRIEGALDQVLACDVPGG